MADTEYLKMAVGGVLAKARSKLRFLGCRGVAGIARKLRGADASSFARVVGDALSVSVPDAEALAWAFATGNGVDVDSFMERLRGEVSARRLALIDAAFDALDGDKSGKVDMAEYLIWSLRDALTRSSQRVVDLFRAWDEDRSGTVDKGEFHKAVRSLGFDVEKEDTDAVFDSLDDDRSGKLEYKELAEMLRKGVLDDRMIDVDLPAPSGGAPPNAGAPMNMDGRAGYGAHQKLAAPAARAKECVSFAGDVNADTWCDENCRAGFCPPAKCTCAGGLPLASQKFRSPAAESARQMAAAAKGAEEQAALAAKATVNAAQLASFQGKEQQAASTTATEAITAATEAAATATRTATATASTSTASASTTSSAPRTRRMRRATRARGDRKSVV